LRESFSEAGKRGLGHSLIRFHGNFTTWIKDNSKKSSARYVDQHWLSAFDSGGNDSKAMYKTVRELPKTYIAATNILEGSEDEWKNLKWMIIDRSEITIDNGFETSCARSRRALEQGGKNYDGA